MKVCVVGLGYIGLPTALMLAAHDVDVVGVDYSKTVVDSLNSGNLTFNENGLDDLFQTALTKGISFTDSYVNADVYIVAVPTPYDKSTKRIDASYVVSAVDSICKCCDKNAIIVIESTIAPGTIDAYIRPIIKENGYSSESDIHLAHAPERIIPGNMIAELINNNRTIGADSEEVAEKVRTIYSSFCQGEITLTDIRTAELSKVVENTFRDINIAFANELAKICHSAELDVYEIIRIANCHPRVNILNPGPGVGGHCISVDPWFLVGDFPNLANLTWEARRINDSMPEYVLMRTREVMEKHGIKDNSKVGFYGLTYKENVDDIRESPTLQLLDTMKLHLTDVNQIKTYDPFVTERITDNQMDNLDLFLDSIELVVVMVAHNEIIEATDKLKNKVVLDTRRCLPLEHIETL